MDFCKYACAFVWSSGLYIGTIGGAGAMIVQWEEYGKLAGKIVIEILENGKKPKDIYPAWDRYGKFYFNRKQIKIFNIKIPEIISEICFQLEFLKPHKKFVLIICKK